MFTSPNYPSINCEDANCVKFKPTSNMHNSVPNCCNSENFYHGFGSPTGKTIDNLVQGDPNQNLRFQIALSLKLCISDLML